MNIDLGINLKIKLAFHLANAYFIDEDICVV